MKTVFEFLDYTHYLDEKGGTRTLLAKKIGCQSSYLSRVMKRNADISLEQADRINLFLKHSKEESRYFLLLVNYARSGTSSLRKNFKEEIDQIRSDRLHLRTRFNVPTLLSAENRAIYYSAWIYSACHIALTIPNFRRIEVLSSLFHSTPEKTQEVLDFLLSVGLAIDDGGTYRPGPVRIHLGNDDRLLENHHRNWRLRSIETFSNRAQEDIRYSAVVSLSAEDYPKLRELLVKAIEEFNATVKPSKEELLCSFCLDFFKI